MTDTQFTQRNVVVESVDRAGKKLAYETEAIKLVLRKSDNTVSVEATTTDHIAIQLAEEAKERYEQLLALSELINDLSESTATCIPLFDIKSLHERWV